MQRWSAARIFSYKEIKAATNNFRDVIGNGGFGSVYLGKLSDGKLVAVKVRLDKTQLGADSFFNEVNIHKILSIITLQSPIAINYESCSFLFVLFFFSF